MRACRWTAPRKGKRRLTCSKTTNREKGGDIANTTNPQTPTNRKLAARTGALERPGGLLGARVRFATTTHFKVAKGGEEVGHSNPERHKTILLVTSELHKMSMSVYDPSELDTHIEELDG